MVILEKFYINNNTEISIQIPNFPDKTNLYSAPTKKIDKFDEGTVIYQENSNKIVLSTDIIIEITNVFNNLLKNILTKQNQIDIKQIPNSIGYLYNIETFNELPESINYSDYWLWSKNGIQTWLYSDGDKIYLEISPSYKWLFVEPKNEKDFITFDDFIKNYKTIAKIEIDNNTINKWHNQCQNLLKKLYIGLKS